MARDPSFIPKLANKARLRFDRHSGSHMIVYPERGLALNDSAAKIAKRCDGTRSLTEIVDELAREAGVDAQGRADVEADVLAFVDLLAQKGLLEP
ncbi:MAG: pyrroloquinoline quinone biosynthesis peptide chaperone PqqD [Labilithrix sp.]|nr:pyrroloquinoline quinone biosynthesis peptide chaperone PqqD [Labilithrix sp.]